MDGSPVPRSSMSCRFDLACGKHKGQEKKEGPGQQHDDGKELFQMVINFRSSLQPSVGVRFHLPPRL